MAKVIQIFVALCSIVILINGELVKNLDLAKVEICYLKEDIPLKIYYLNLDKSEHNFTISAAWEFLEDIDDKQLSLEIFLTKCTSKEEEESCGKYLKAQPKLDLCKYLGMDFLGIRKITDICVPQFRCPFTKGNTTLPPFWYDYNDFTVFPLGDYYWKLKANLYGNKDLVISWCVEGQLKEYDI